MPAELSAHELVGQLRTVGRRPAKRLVERILAYGAAARAPLLDLATDIQALYTNEPACWGPIHALRLLGEQPDPAIIAPLLGVLPVHLRYERDHAPELWAGEVLDVLSLCGPAAIPTLWQLADDEAQSQRTRGAAIQTMILIAATSASASADLRADLEAGARARLEQTQDRAIAAFLISLLANLGAAAAYQEIMAAYRAGRVDTTIFAAADARQMLFGQNRPEYELPQSFWERYEMHGPFANA